MREKEGEGEGVRTNKIYCRIGAVKLCRLPCLRLWTPGFRFSGSALVSDRIFRM